MVLGTRRKWPRPRRLPPETETLTMFLETSPDRNAETETTTLATGLLSHHHITSPHITSHGVDGRRPEGFYIGKIHCNISIYTFNTNL